MYVVAGSTGALITLSVLLVLSVVIIILLLVRLRNNNKSKMKKDQLEATMTNTTEPYERPVAVNQVSGNNQDHRYEDLRNKELTKEEQIYQEL